jgi:zinc protease
MRSRPSPDPRREPDPPEAPNDPQIPNLRRIPDPRRVPVLGRVLILAAAAAALACAPRSSKQEGSYILENGLAVHLIPVQEASETALAVLYDLGGDHDPEGRSGLAHLIEHLYATAAAGDIPARTILEQVRRYPSGWNAQTGDRYTVFAAVFPPDSLRVELRDAALRMSDIQVTEEDLERERRRLHSEVANMYGGIPALACRNLARELAVPTPARGRRGGVPEQVNAITLEETRTRLWTYYGPGNARLVLAGSFRTGDVRRLVEQEFSGVPEVEPPPPLRERKAAGGGNTETALVHPIQQGMGPEACVAYPAPFPGDALYPAFLVHVARLWEKARESGRPGVRVQYAPLDDPRAAYFQTSVENTLDPEASAERIRRFVSETVAPAAAVEEIARARDLFGVLLGFASVQGGATGDDLYRIAFAAGRREQMGIDPSALDEAIRNVNEPDFREAAEKFFGPDRGSGVVVLTE